MITKDDIKGLSKKELQDIVIEASEKDANFKRFVYNRVSKKSISSKEIKSLQIKLRKQRVDFNQADRLFKEYSLLINDSYTYRGLVKDYIEFLIQTRDENIHDMLEDLDEMIIDVFRTACELSLENNDMMDKKYIAKMIGKVDFVFENLSHNLDSLFMNYFHEYYDEMD